MTNQFFFFVIVPFGSQALTKILVSFPETVLKVFDRYYYYLVDNDLLHILNCSQLVTAEIILIFGKKKYSQKFESGVKRASISYIFKPFFMQIFLYIQLFSQNSFKCLKI